MEFYEIYATHQHNERCVDIRGVRNQHNKQYVDI